MNRTVVAALVLAAALPAAASTRLTYSVNGKPVALAWDAGAFPLAYTIDTRLAGALPNGTDLISRSFNEWASRESVVGFGTPAVAPAGAGRDGRNSISPNDELFQVSGFLAFTTTWFDDSGRILESDIQVDDEAIARPNFGALVQHEVGHMLGLDHSGILSAAMYPYVAPEGNRALDSDDRMAVASLYPSTSNQQQGIVRGEVRNFRGGVFGAQVVVSSSEGSIIASTLTDAQGRFSIAGLPDGEYRLFAEPLDGPVGPDNMSGVWRDVAEPFRTSVRDEELVSVRAGAPAEVVLTTDGQPTLNPKWIGTFPAGTQEIRLSSNATTVTPGTTVSIAVGGEGFLPGVTTFDILSTRVERVSDFTYGANHVYATYRIAADAPSNALVVMVRNGTEAAALTGALQVQAPPARRRGAR